jgi:hypothetical protein
MRIFGTITKELTARVVIITSIYSIISYFVIERHHSTSDNLATAIPLLFVTFGVVILISILYCLRRYHVWNAKNEPTVDREK